MTPGTAGGSRRDGVPDAAEVLARARVAFLDQASGTYLRSAGVTRDAAPGRVGVVVPAEVEVTFTHEGPDRTTVEGPDDLPVVTDGSRVLQDGDLVPADVLAGPQTLLRPFVPYDGAVLVRGIELLGRRCWQVQVDEEHLWVDAETGVLLQHSGLAGVARLTSLVVDPGPTVVPSWPRLNGWLARPRVSAVRASIRWQDGDAGGDGGLRWTASGGWAPTSLPSRFGLLVLSEPFECGDDYWRADGPAVPCTVAGRDCWQVHLLPPERKNGLLELRIDDETGLVLRTGNAEHGFSAEVTALDVGESGVAGRAWAG